MKNRISVIAAISIGIGGMIGAGIFSILGVVAEASGAAMWLSFLIGGVVALFSTYSYAKLGAKFPSAGGAVEFLVKGWGTGTVSGGLNLFMWIGYVIAIALYAQGFSSYAMTFITGSPSPLVIKAVAAGAGLFFIQPANLAPVHWNSTEYIFFGAGVLFIGYEGFGLITNAAGNMDNPSKSLPKALYLAVFIVILIYLAVSITVTGNLTTGQIAAARDFALAEAAKPFLGMFGFKLIAVAALFSTASAINATLFGGSNVSYMVAKDGELPAIFSRDEIKGATGGLLITSLMVICFILFFDLAGIAMMGSGAFLLVYAAVNAGHLRILKQTGAKAWLVVVSLILCLIMFVILEVYTYRKAPEAVYTMIALLIASFIAEAIWQKFRKKNN